MTAKVVRSPRRPFGLAAVLLIVATYLVVGAGRAEAGPVGLGTATSYAVLAGSAVTNTGSSVLTGDVGVSPGTAITGFPPGLASGTLHSADAAAAQAKGDLTLAYDDAAGRTPATSIVAELGGRTLGAGVYTGATLEMTGALTLDGAGDPDAVFVFQAQSTLITASNSSVVLIGDANPCNVYWQVGSSATLGTGASFVGTLMAMESITATTGATIEGRLLARTGGVTLDTNLITRPDCATLPAGSTTTATPTSTTEATTSTTEGPTTSTVTSSTTTPVASSTTTPVVTSTTTPVVTSTTTPVVTSTTIEVGNPTTAPSGSTTGPDTEPSVPVTDVEATTTRPGIGLTEGSGPTTSRTGTTTPTSTSTTTELARTGSDTGRLVLIGVLAIGAGAALIIASRRRIRLAA